MDRHAAYVFYFILCFVVFALTMLVYVPGAIGFLLWLVTPTVERTGG
jgi:hypothetical protein